MRGTSVSIEPEAFDVRESISTMKLSYEAICRKKSITFSFSAKIEDFPYYVLGDRITHPDTPAMAITGNVLEEDVQKYLSAGFVNVLAKPTCKRDLVCALDELRIGETFRV